MPAFVFYYPKRWYEPGRPALPTIRFPVNPTIGNGYFPAGWVNGLHSRFLNSFQERFTFPDTRILIIHIAFVFDAYPSMVTGIQNDIHHFFIIGMDFVSVFIKIIRFS